MKHIDCSNEAQSDESGGWGSRSFSKRFQPKIVTSIVIVARVVIPTTIRGMPSKACALLGRVAYIVQEYAIINSSHAINTVWTKYAALIIIVYFEIYSDTK